MIKNEISSYQIPSPKLPKKWPNLPFTFTPITPNRLYKGKTKNPRRLVEVVEFMRVEIFNLGRTAYPLLIPLRGAPKKSLLEIEGMF